MGHLEVLGLEASFGSPYAVLDTTPRNVGIPNQVNGVTMSWFIESKADQTQETERDRPWPLSTPVFN